MNSLRFAPLVRVSTEAQERKGESLRTQQEQITEYVKQLGGEVVSWDYSGQEHATPDQERQKLDQLLSDASNGRFDAVIVCDLSRWSRDNQRSKKGIEILKRAGIRFFVCLTEYDLHSPEQAFFVGMATEINEFYANNQSLKSIQSRINRAKRGIPTAGKLPYGRTWSEVEGWGIDRDKQQNIQYAAKRYLAGESMEKVAQKLGMNHSNLWKILTKRAGTDWEVGFRNTRLKIDDNVVIKVPPLLSEEAIASIKEKAASNKTYTHGQLKYEYLLGRVVFCAKCGYAMFGQTNRGNRRYYRHARGRVNECDSSLWVPAQQLEDAVIVNLFAMFGDIERIEKAVEMATPDEGKVELFNARLGAIDTEQAGVREQSERVVVAIAKGIITDKDAQLKMNNLRERDQLLSDEKRTIEASLEALPNYRKRLGSIRLAMAGAKMVSSGMKVSAFFPDRLGKMSFAAKRKVVEAAFSGKNGEERLGVYVWKENGTWHYDIRGVIPPEKFLIDYRFLMLQGTLPMTKRQAQNILEVDTDYSDFNPLTEETAGKTRFVSY